MEEVNKKVKTTAKKAEPTKTKATTKKAESTKLQKIDSKQAATDKMLSLIDANGKINHMGIFIQIVLLILLAYFAITYLFIPELNIVTQYILTALLFVMSYNNHDVYKRKGLTLVYFITGMLVLFATVYMGING